MYICLDCGSTFDAPAQWGEYSEHFGLLAREVFDGCPSCQGDYAIAERCLICGKYYPAEDVNDGFCDNCGAKLLRRCNIILAQNFNAYELSYLMDNWEG